MLTQLHDPPQAFKQLFEDPLFVVKVRSYIIIVAFTSMGVSLAVSDRIDEQLGNAREGFCTLSVPETICHCVGTFLPTESRTSGFAQLYVFDSDMETPVTMRRCVMNGLDREIVATVQRVLSHVNSFVEMPLRVGKFIRNQEVQSVRLAIHESLGIDWRTQNSPRVTRWSPFYLMIIRDPNETLFRTNKVGGLYRISDTQPAYDPFHFPLLFPHGELGWHLAVLYQRDATSHNINRVACGEFAAYRLHQGQWVLIATSRSKIFSMRGFLTTEMRGHSLPGSPGTSGLVVKINLGPNISQCHFEGTFQ